MRRNSVILSISAMLTLVLSYALAVERNSDSSLVPSVQARPAVAPQIEGTWLLTVTTPPEAGRPPFKVLVSFARGGVFIASAESDQATAPQNGTWKMVGPNEYASTALSFGPDPNNLFTIKIKGLNRLVSENELEGVGEAAICDASGNNCQRFPGCSTIHGTRLTVEPPSCPGT
jgi:hypothetical protein